MHKPISISYQALVWRCFLPIAVSTIFSCNHNAPKPHELIKKEKIQKPPVTIAAKPKVVTLLDTCPPPKTIQLLPPEKKSASFYVSMQNFTTKNGLSHNSVGRGCLDKNGNLWFGSFGGGVSRYDGKSFTNYNTSQGLPNNYVWSVFEDKRGNLWFGTGGGVIRYDGKSFRSYTTAEGLANNLVSAITEDKGGNIWFGTGEGLSFLKQGTDSINNYKTIGGFARYAISSMVLDKTGNIWYGTWADGGVTCYNGKFFVNYTVVDGLANNFVKSIIEDKNGNLWFGNDSGKITFLEREKIIKGEKPNFKTYTFAEGVPNVQTITEDSKGNLWFGTDGGAFRLAPDKKMNPLKENFTVISMRQGLPNNNVNSILEDKSGNIWFSSDDGGISRLDKDLKFLSNVITSEGLLSAQVATILEDERHNIWFGTLGDGLLRLTPDGKSLLKYSASQGLPNNNVFKIYEDKSGNIWALNFEGGVSRLSADGKYLTKYTTAHGLPNFIGKIFEDKHGNFWFGTREGAFRLSPANKSISSYTTAQGLPDNAITNIFEDKSGNIWLATSKGVSRLSMDGESLTNYSTEHGLSNNSVTGILEDINGNIWFGTDGSGVNRYDGKSFVSFTTAEGLSDDKIKDVVMGKEGIIWLGTEKGFTAIKGFVQTTDTVNNIQKHLPASNKLTNTELEHNNFKPVFEIYNIKTGYPIEAITSNLLVTQEGIIWAGIRNRERVGRFDYSTIHKNPDPATVFIQNIKINNEPVCWYDLIRNEEQPDDSLAKSPNVTEELNQFGKILDEDRRLAMRKKFSAVKFDSISRFYSVPVNLVLPYEHNNITFEFTAIEPARPAFVRYQYMMEGYEKEWSPVSDKTNATYGNIHEGSYIFKLKAQSPDGVWGKPITYTFRVLPPWYRTWWAYTLYILVFAALVWSLIKWRVSALKKEKQLLEQKVILRTHELQDEKEKVETTLTELKSAQAQLIQSEKMASLGELTAGIAHEIQNPLNFVNNFSEVNKELLIEMKVEMDNGNIDDAKSIANDIADNEQKINYHGKRADAIVKGMLQHSRISSGMKEPTDINALADEYLRLAYHGLRAKDSSFHSKLETAFDNSIGKINIVPQDIGRVLLNLINNAFYAVNERRKNSPQIPIQRHPGVPEGGNIYPEKEYEPTVTVITKKIGNKVEIQVRDNGDGIPPKVLDKIFQPFFTTKPTGEGTGLGLSLSYDIIKAHGGELKVETRGNEGLPDDQVGTTFIITL